MGLSTEDETMDYDERPDPVIEETNRERIRNIVWDEIGLRTPLGNELEYILEVWGDDPECASHDYADAFDHVYSVATHNGDRGIERACVNILIRVGYYQPRRGSVTIMGRDRSPVRKGQRYDCVAAWCEWIER
jgi:hypothetical protein